MCKRHNAARWPHWPVRGNKHRCECFRRPGPPRPHIAFLHMPRTMHRSIDSLMTSPASCSGSSLVTQAPPFAQARPWRGPARLRVACEYSRDARNGPVRVQRQPQQQRAAYEAPPPARTSGEPPRLPPEQGGAPPDPDGGGGGMSNLTKAFVAGAFILGARRVPGLVRDCFVAAASRAPRASSTPWRAGPSPAPLLPPQTPHPPTHPHRRHGRGHLVRLRGDL
jgi:hypothetical protein